MSPMLGELSLAIRLRINFILADVAGGGGGGGPTPLSPFGGIALLIGASYFDVRPFFR